jgi:hypothetical protein
LCDFPWGRCLGFCKEGRKLRFREERVEYDGITSVIIMKTSCVEIDVSRGNIARQPRLGLCNL